MLEALTGLLLPDASDRVLVAAELTHAWSLTAVGFALAAGVLAAAIYAWREQRRLAPRRAVILFVVRGMLLASLAWLLSEPALKAEFETARPGRVAMLVDTSASMGLVDAAGTPRHAPVLDLVAPENGPLATFLRNRASPLSVSLHGLAEGADDLPNSAELAFGSGHTSLGPRLDALRRSGGAPVSAVVLLSDGDFRLRPADRQTLRQMRASGIPVHTVSVGPDSVGNDFEVAALNAPDRLLVGAVAAVDARIRKSGQMPGEAIVRLEVDGIERDRASVRFDDTAEQGVSFQLPVDEGGLRRIEVIVSPDSGEPNTANNRAAALLYAEDRELSILHVEGEPRFEVKFIRRAVQDDDNLRILSLVRTAENKFYRLGISSAEELKDGFPRTAEDLFKYDGLVLGSAPQDMLTPAQQQLIADFAARRGGGVVFLGGRHAFAEGGYERGPVTQMLPFALQRGVPERSVMLKLEMTGAGRQHAVARIGAGARGVTALADLPPLTSVNASVGGLETLKPGAAALWSGTVENRTERRIGLAEQRYGKGMVAAFAVRDTWRWQMHRALDLEDQTHETFWRQWLRWLTRGARPQRYVTVDARQVAPGQAVTLRAHAVDASHVPVADAGQSLVVITPSGERVGLALEPGTAPGVQTARYVAREPGAHEVELTHPDSGEADGTAVAFFDVQALGREMYSAVRNDTVMRNVARLSGGQFVSMADAESLFDTIESNVATVTQFDVVSLLELPALLAWLLALASVEWLARRRWRLP
ncbi:MAG: hypothetical protein AAF458_13105 [Pseudomonadota bacterium]